MKREQLKKWFDKLPLLNEALSRTVLEWASDEENSRSKIVTWEDIKNLVQRIESESNKHMLPKLRHYHPEEEKDDTNSDW